ncbi:MAG: exosortase-associated EpsI family protein [Limisphaerales bacterium]
MTGSGINVTGIALNQRHMRFVAAGVLTGIILLLWQFPRFWYDRRDPHAGSVWLSDQTNVAEWTYHPLPTSKAAESVLVADRVVSGEFINHAGARIRVFLAERFNESSNEIGLFVHTPDRCWTEAGWTLMPAQPEFVVIPFQGVSVGVERRIFQSGREKELVYFAGMVGGQALPYRLDHNLSVGMKLSLRTGRDRTGTTFRATDSRFWNRIWEAFCARRRLAGPKQFFRVSISVAGQNTEQGEVTLRSFLCGWLMPAPFVPVR